MSPQLYRSRIGAAIVAVLLFSSALGGSRPATLSTSIDSSAGLQPAAPDLLIESATIRVAEQCRPSSPLLYISATIYNRGAGPAFEQRWSSVVYARETYERGWGNGLKLPALAEGGRRSVTFPIYFLNSAPNSMAGTHKFVIRVAAGADVRESNYGNNRFGPLVVDVPSSLCRRGDGNVK